MSGGPASGGPASMSGPVRSPKKRPADPNVVLKPPTPKKIVTYVCTLQNGVGFSINVHNMGQDNLALFEHEVLQMRAGQMQEKPLNIYGMPVLWKADHMPGWVRALDACSLPERTVSLALFKQWLTEHNIVHRDQTFTLDPFRPPITVYIGRDQDADNDTVTYTIIGAASSNMRTINQGALVYPRPQWIPGDMTNPANNWAWYFEDGEHLELHGESGYTRCPWAMAMKYYLRCLVKGYSFTPDSALQDTVIPNLPAELRDYHARLQEIHDAHAATVD